MKIIATDPDKAVMRSLRNISKAPKETQEKRYNDLMNMWPKHHDMILKHKNQNND